MADEQIGLRKEDLRDWAPWTKLFSGFRVAMDPKKLILAAAGILTMSLGWWLLSLLFFNMRAQPDWSKYQADYEKDKQQLAWNNFKSDLNSWNLLYHLAGPVPANREAAAKLSYKVNYTVADVATSPTEYDAIEKEMAAIEQETNVRRQKVRVEKVTDQKWLFIGDGQDLGLQFDSSAALDELQPKLDRKYRAQDLADAYNAKTKTITLGGFDLTLTNEQQWTKFTNELAKGKSLLDIENEIADGQRQNPKVAKKALQLLRWRDQGKYKPSGMLSTLPWFEYRGGNPFLMVSGLNPTTSDESLVSAKSGNNLIGWFVNDQVPVLLEPLFKFLTPVVYLLHPAAGGMNRIYLLLIIFWTLAVWAFFGGAITRMACVQVARHNEKVGLMDAIKFTMSRYRSYFAAQILPLAFLAGLTVILFLFGFLEVFTFFFGDIIVAGLGLPLALLFGLIMAVVMVGLIGWPMMYATISTEGSDSFDAISRSYSYVYQAPWNYLFYCFIAVIYGAALVFFVGLMGSLMVYLTKWGMTLTPSIYDRNPTYLFAYAPTSYGWRDLLLIQYQFAQPVEVIRPSGELGLTYEVVQSEQFSFGPHNYIGAFLVGVWVYALFLFVVGFGYSYFWTAASIIYLLMRRKVDDTEMDEIHLEDEDLDTPYTPPATPAAPATGNGGGTSLPMVEAPPSTPKPTPPPSPAPTTPPPEAEKSDTESSAPSAASEASDGQPENEEPKADATSEGSDGESDDKKSDS